MNETLIKLQTDIDACHAAMEGHLADAEKEGATDEQKAAALAAFDQQEARLKDLKASQARHAKLLSSKAAAAEFAAQPARDPIPQTPHHRHPAALGGAGATIPANVRRHGRLEAFAGDDAADRAYEAGLWAAGTLFRDQCSPALVQQFADYQATLNTIDNARGGYFVPDVLDTAILELTEQYGIFRRYAEIDRMTSDTKMSPRWTGGMTAYWTHEGGTTTQSDPTWDMIQLVAKKLSAKAKMTRELEEDSLIELGDRVAKYAAIAFAYAEDNAGWNGDGTSAYGGIVGLLTKLADSGNAASVVTAASTHTTPATLTLADYYAVLGAYPNWDAVNPRWFCHKEVFAASMMPLQLAVGGTTPTDIQGGARPTFLGYPVEFVNVGRRLAASTAGTIPVVFGDLKLSSKLGDRRRSRTLRAGLENDDFSRELITLFAACRLDIVNHTITDPKDSAKPGPVVGLKTAAS